MPRTEIAEAVRDARSAVNALQRQARFVGQLLAALNEHLDELEQLDTTHRTAEGGTANGTTHQAHPR